MAAWQELPVEPGALPAWKAGGVYLITDPIPELLDRLGMRQRPGGVNSRLMLNYGGLTADGRVYVGRGGGEIAFGNIVGTRFDASPRFAREVEAGDDLLDGLARVARRGGEFVAGELETATDRITAEAVGYGSTITIRSTFSIAAFISRPRVCELGAWPQ